MKVPQNHGTHESGQNRDRIATDPGALVRTDISLLAEPVEYTNQAGVGADGEFQ